MMVTLFNDILLFLHFGSASGMPPVPQSTCYCLVRFRLARVRSSGRAIVLALQKTSSPVPSHPIWTGRVNSESSPGETASCDRAGCEGAACGRRGRSSFAFRDAEAGRLLLLQFLSWRLRLQSLSRLRLNHWECSFLALVSVHGRTKGVSNIRINRRIRRARSKQSADGRVGRSAWSPRSRI
jgi:hypothetical protein